MDLDELVRKVERGDRLSADELARLRAAPPTFTHLLAIAHALIEHDAPREALPLLETLQRQRPREVQVHLARARAFLLLDRFADAEAALNHALELNPGDPEAKKPLAVLALRRGESARARALVEEVLARDPFDQEAQLLAGELGGGEFGMGDLRAGERTAVQRGAGERSAGERSAGERREAASSATAEKADWQTFVSALSAALRRANVPARRQGRALLLRLGAGRTARVGLEPLHARYLEGDLSLVAAVARLVEEFREQSAPGLERDLLANVLPVLRPESFAREALEPLSRPHPTSVSVLYVLPDPTYLRFVTGAMAREAGVSLDALDEAAWHNLRPAPIERMEHAGVTLWRLCGEDAHDAARLLLAEQQALLARELGPPPWRARVTLEAGTLVCQEGSLAARRVLEALAPDPTSLGRDLVLPV